MTDHNANRPGYKMTPAGWIPEEWEVARLDRFVGLQRGYDLTHETSTLGDVPVVTSSGISYYHAKSKVHPPGVVTGRKGILGKVFLLQQPFWPHDTSLWVSDFKGNDPCFVFWFLQGMRLERFDAATSVPTLNRNNVHSVRVPFPPLPEQRKIAEVLTTWDEAINQTRALIAAAKRRKKALMQQLLTGKKRLPGFETAWKKTPIGVLLEEVERPVTWADDATYSLVSVRRASGGAFLREERRGKDILTKVMYQTRTGDFLISRMQVLHGAMALVSAHLDGMHISGSYIALRPRNTAAIDLEFFAMLASAREFYHLAYLSSYGVHIEKMTFNLEWFFQSMVRIPADVTEQRAIAAVLTTADEEINSLEAKFAALERQKKGLMQKLLTGEVRVRL